MPTPLCVQGAQAIEVIPWVEEEKARQAEWVQVGAAACCPTQACLGVARIDKGGRAFLGS